MEKRLQSCAERSRFREALRDTKLDAARQDKQSALDTEAARLRALARIAASAPYADAVATRERGIPYLSLPEPLRHFFMTATRNLVLTGTHGKTTTTSMVMNTVKSMPSTMITMIMQAMITARLTHMRGKAWTMP